MPFTIVKGDISHMQTDAVVNAANEQLMPGGGVCGAIFGGAGYEQMWEACRQIGRCPTGSAVVTPAFNLPATYVIHAVGPQWQGGAHGEEALLRNAYRSALSRAVEVGARSVAFPLISAGIYGYPQAAARTVATQEIRSFLAEHDEFSVFLVLYNRRQFAQTLERYRAVSSYIDAVERSVKGRELTDGAARSMAFLKTENEEAAAREQDAPRSSNASLQAAPLAAACAAPSPPGAAAAPAGSAAPAPVPAAPSVGLQADLASHRDLTWRLAHLDATFSSTVLSLIDERGLTDVEVYKRANLSRQVFSKLRKDDGYRPTKQTAVALAVALELDRTQTDMLLRRAGYALSRTNKFDVIVEYFIEEGVYDVFALNEMLFAFDQPLLGSL